MHSLWPTIGTYKLCINYDQIQVLLMVTQWINLTQWIMSSVGAVTCDSSKIFITDMVGLPAAVTIFIVLSARYRATPAIHSEVAEK